MHESLSSIAPRTGVLAAYAGIHFPLSLTSLVVLVYVPVLYGELGIPLALIGTVLMAARLGDVVTDPLIGWLSDRTHAALGRRKPWVLAGTPLLMISVWMLFVPPEAPSVGYFAFWIVAYYFAFTVADLPYLAWGAELSDSYTGRTAIASWRELSGFLGKLAATTLPIALVAIGVPGVRDMAIVDAALVLLLLPLSACWLFRSVPDRPIERAARPSASIARRLRVIVENGPFMRILTGYTGSLIAGAMDGAISFFFCKHALGIESWYAVALFVHLLAAVLGIPFWNMLGSRLGKHRALVGAIVWYACWAFCMPLLTLDALPVWAVAGGFVTLQAAKGFALGSFEALSASMAADVIELDAVRTGARRAGVYFSVWGIVKKSAAAFAALVALAGIDLFGFDATRDPALVGAPGGNSEQAILALTILYSFLPSCFKLAVLPILWRYPLTAARLARLREAATDAGPADPRPPAAPG
ncbi:MAG: MFS transporter [Pseudomonadales bacterium]|jgi:Na+/melibiose symporter-like transporter|nr:MFS transporter [Pseudomonadales bacterium]